SACIVGAVGSLVVRASDSRPEGLSLMPRYTKHLPVHTEYVLVNQWVRSLVGLITSAGTGEYFLLQLTCRNCGGGDRGRVALYRPFRNFAELNRTVTCMVLKGQTKRTSCPCHDEFRGPRSDYVRQVALENNNNNFIV
ncbi:uncharacterized protein TNCV_540251, partial [Trichonephila clavipes]